MIDAYLTDTVTLKIRTYDQWQTASISSQVSIKARIEYKSRMVLNQQGEQAVTSAIIMIKDRTITYSDLLNFDGRDHRILNITKDKDFTRNRILNIGVA